MGLVEGTMASAGGCFLALGVFLMGLYFMTHKFTLEEVLMLVATLVLASVPFLSDAVCRWLGWD